MKAAFDYDDTNKGTNKGWVMFIGDEVEADDDSKGKNFPKVAYKYFIKKLVNSIKHAEGIEDNDIELAEDLIVTESGVDYYKDLFVGGNSSNGKLEELLAQEDPEAGPYGGREKRGKWEELGFFSQNGFAFLTVEGGSGKLQAILKQYKDFVRKCTI